MNDLRAREIIEFGGELHEKALFNFRQYRLGWVVPISDDGSNEFEYK